MSNYTQPIGMIVQEWCDEHKDLVSEKLSKAIADNAKAGNEEVVSILNARLRGFLWATRSFDWARGDYVREWFVWFMDTAWITALKHEICLEFRGEDYPCKGFREACDTHNGLCAVWDFTTLMTALTERMHMYW